MIIGIVGFKGSGKDTLADYFITHGGYNKYSFAKPLKEAARILFGWSDHQVNDPIIKEQIDPFWGISPRNALQWLGTEGMREGMPNAYPLFKDITGNNFWIKRFEMVLRQNPQLDYILPDVRFQNEVDCIRHRDGAVIRIERESAIPARIEHPSEDVRSLRGVTTIVLNNGTIAELYDKAKLLMEGL